MNGRTINLHTNLKGKIKKVGGQEVFVENEKDISDEDLKALRKLSRDLDSGASPYFCIVSVLMLREGWDVKNVFQIVPHEERAFNSKLLIAQGQQAEIHRGGRCESGGTHGGNERSGRPQSRDIDDQ